MSKADFKQWERGLQILVRNNGQNKGRRVRFWGAREDSKGRPIMTVEYCDTKQFAYPCRPWNYTPEELWEEKPYKPKPESIEDVKEWLTDERFILNINDGKYFWIWYNRFDYKITQRLIAEGFLERSGRLGSVFKNKGLSWEDYRKEQRKIGKRPVHHNCIVYKILKDISQFEW